MIQTVNDPKEEAQDSAHPFQARLRIQFNLPIHFYLFAADLLAELS